MALGTVEEYVTTARVLLQDEDAEYRYTDAQLLVALNAGLMEMRRLRPDLFIGSQTTAPSFSTVDSTAVSVDQQYRMALVYYIVGHAELRDHEGTDDARANIFYQKFTAQLLGLQA